MATLEEDYDREKKQHQKDVEEMDRDRIKGHGKAEKRHALQNKGDQRACTST